MSTNQELQIDMSRTIRRRKRQRIYWAEIGFLILGLIALRPSIVAEIAAMGKQSQPQRAYGWDPIHDLYGAPMQQVAWNTSRPWYESTPTAQQVQSLYPALLAASDWGSPRTSYASHSPTASYASTPYAASLFPPTNTSPTYNSAYYPTHAAASRQNAILPPSSNNYGWNQYAATSAQYAPTSVPTSPILPPSQYANPWTGYAPQSSPYGASGNGSYPTSMNQPSHLLASAPTYPTASPNGTVGNNYTYTSPTTTFSAAPYTAASGSQVAWPDAQVHQFVHNGGNTVNGYATPWPATATTQPRPGYPATNAPSFGRY